MKCFMNVRIRINIIILFNDCIEFDREDISSEEGGYMQSGGQLNSRKRFASHDDRIVDADDVNRTKAMESHNENERKRFVSFLCAFVIHWLLFITDGKDLNHLYCDCVSS